MADGAWPPDGQFLNGQWRIATCDSNLVQFQNQIAFKFSDGDPIESLLFAKAKLMVRLKTHSKDDWSSIVAQHSGITPRHDYDDLDSDSTNDSKLVIRGWQEARGGGPDQVINTGFLENETGSVVAGVNSIPRDAVDTESDESTKGK